MGVPIVLHPPAQIDRRALNLPTDKFIFLYAFDMLSIPERKNPLGLIEAYRPWRSARISRILAW